MALYKSLTKAAEALEEITSWEGKKKAIACLMILFGMDPTKPLIGKGDKS